MNIANKLIDEMQMIEFYAFALGRQGKKSDDRKLALHKTRFYKLIQKL